MRPQDTAMASRKVREPLSPFEEAYELIEEMQAELKNAAFRLRIEKAFGQAIVVEIAIGRADKFLKLYS